jgi:F-type H+-transporting ATPase subunit a
VEQFEKEMAHMLEHPFAPHGGWLHWASRWGIDDFVAWSWVVILGLVLFAVLATRGWQLRPGRLQNFVEWVVESLNSFCRGIIGPHGDRYTPLVGSLFIYILLMNLIGLIPGFASPTASLNMTVALAMVVFVAVQIYGLREHGLVNYLKHFLGEPLWMSWLMFPIHVIGEFAKPMSLSLRLFGNIFGEDTIIVVLAMLSAFLLPRVLPIPFQFPLMLFALFTSFVQALIFSMLTAVYIALITEHAEEHH